MHLPILPQRRHPHNFNHQARPAREMLRALPFPRLSIILLPREARLRPGLENCLYKIMSQTVV